MATMPEIKKQLEELGVESDSKLKKPELEALLQAQEHVVTKDPVIGTFNVSNKLKSVYYTVEVKDANGKTCVQIQCLDGSIYRVSVEEAEERLKLK